MLLHNDITVDNVYRADCGQLKVFDYGLSAIGHPCMDYSLKWSGKVYWDSFREMWANAGFDCSNMNGMRRNSTLATLLVQLIFELDALKGARASDKLELASVVEDSCDFIVTTLPEDPEGAVGS